MNELLSWTDRPDCEIIPRLLALHAPARDPLRILDATANRGQMWKGSGYAPTVRLDIDAGQGPDVVGDCRALPFADGCFDVITFDPPHVPGAGERHTGVDWAARYGLGVLPNTTAAGVTALFAPFLHEAARVLAPDGLILTKLADGIAHSRYWWYHVDFVQAVRAVPGLTPCDLRIKIRGGIGMPTDPRQERQVHHRAAHSYWIVARKGDCQGAGLRRPARSQTVGLPLFAPPDAAGPGVGG